MANSLTLQQMRDLLRLTLDVEVEDVPDDLIDSWAQEGFNLAIAAEENWRFYEVVQSFGTTAGQQFYDLASFDVGNPLSNIYSVRGPRWELLPVSEGNAETAFTRNLTTTREPNFFSVWGGMLVLWPIPDTGYSIEVRGHRKPQDWIAAGGAAAVPDCPNEFHRAIFTWVLSRGYLQQDDPGQAQMYEQQFSNQLRVLQPKYMRAFTTGPILVNGGNIKGGPVGRLWYDWE